jgi:hypothetical protein
MLDAIDRGCLGGGCLDDEDLRIIFERLLRRRRQGAWSTKRVERSALTILAPPAVITAKDR